MIDIYGHETPKPEKKHRCTPTNPVHYINGPYDVTCYEADDGGLWFTNGVTGIRVNGCPFCLYKAKVQIDIHLKVE